MNDGAFQKGQRVRYVPNHAHGDPKHPDCEDGVVRATGAGMDGTSVFVLYDNLRGRMTTGDEPFTAQCTKTEDLIHLAPEDEDPGQPLFCPSTL